LYFFSVGYTNSKEKEVLPCSIIAAITSYSRLTAPFSCFLINLSITAIVVFSFNFAHLKLANVG
jgi:hypothetical protein